DMLTRIRNAALARKLDVVMPYSKMKESIARILKDNGFLIDFKVTQSGSFKSLELTLPESKDVITSLILVSKPGRRMYVSAKDLPTVLGGRGLVIVSTSHGVMTGRDA